jgi:galactokinase
MRGKLLNWFEEIYEDNEGVDVFFAPGRVNLIGEHTDYNGGHVFPCALEIGTYAAVRLRDDRDLRLYSVNFPESGVIVSSLDEIIYGSDVIDYKNKKVEWTDYPKGIIWTFTHNPHYKKLIEKDGKILPDRGMDILYYGNIPNGSGLSSSASIEVLTTYIIKELYNIDISLKDISLLSQYAENKYVGVNCGIMDQFAVAMGKKNHAIFLDTTTLQYEYAPLNLGNCRIVIANTNKRRGLGDSKYNERRSECEEALRRLHIVTDADTLGDLTNEEFESYKEAIKDDILIRRARHAVYENQRTIEAVEALKSDDLQRFGKLMNESHISLRDDYEVTGHELDTLVEAAWEQEGVIGARMTGAGFGGCTVNIVHNDVIDSFIENVGRIYKEKTGLKADFYVVEVGGGPGKI